MKKSVIIIIVAALLLLIGLVVLIITNQGEGPEKFVTCIAGEEVSDGLSTKVTTVYHYNKSGLKVTGVDYTIEIVSKNDYNQLTTAKTFYENTICNTSNLPSNVTCRMELTEDKLSVHTHENIEGNQSTVLKVGDLSDFTYNSFKDHKEEGVECTLN